ncbi:MAG: DUF2071 domain-containing protein [Armatimonadota bacterium]|nr:DUF2071 domain-containing protein [Armatimonadota bacterium]
MHLLKRHPLPVSAFFRHSLVLAYALPSEVLQPLLPPGLSVDSHGDYGFVAIAMVQTETLRPSFLPKIFGQDFFLSGYRIFSRYKTLRGKNLRGLRILRSDTDKNLMVASGNLLTHYKYQKADATTNFTDSCLEVKITTPGATADVHVTARISDENASLPSGSVFENLKEARRFAGPLPFTFDYEEETNSIIMIKGVRENWNPTLVAADVHRITFFDQPAFEGVTPIFSSAFHVQDIPYRWERGIRETLA